MNHFKQHVPSFIDNGYKRVEFEFKTTADLLNSAVVKKYVEPGSYFVKSDNCLMVVTDNGFHWWVIGYIKNPQDVELPEWDGVKYHALLDGQKVILSSSEILGSCGDTLTLRDGRTAIMER
jgi:hypothetical protein